MKVRIAVTVWAALYFSALTCMAQEPWLGKWALQKAETRITGVHVTGGGQLALESPNVPQNVSLTYEALSDGSVKITALGIFENQQVVAAHWEWVGKFDGNDYPVTGDPEADTRAYKVVDKRTLEVTVKKGGNLTQFGSQTVIFKGKKSTVSVAGGTGTYHKT